MSACESLKTRRETDSRRIPLATAHCTKKLNDFYRLTKYGLSQILLENGFERVEVKSNGGDVARIFLSVNLLFNKKIYFLVRLVSNLAGLFLNFVFYRNKVSG